MSESVDTAGESSKAEAKPWASERVRLIIFLVCTVALVFSVIALAEAFDLAHDWSVALGFSLMFPVKFLHGKLSHPSDIGGPVGRVIQYVN